MSKTRILFLALAVALLLPVATFAKSVKMEESVYVPKDQTVDGTLFTAGSSITIDGVVKGDLICAGQSIVINGTIEGDMLCAGSSIIVNGKIGGSVRSAGSSIVLNGSVGRTAMVAGASVTIAPQAVIGWDAMIGSANAHVGGEVKRDLYGAGANAQITGTVGRHVALWLDEGNNKNKDYTALTVAKQAKVGGNITYTGRSEATIEEGATIGGEVIHNTPQMPARNESGSPVVGWVWFKILSIFAALAVGLVLAAWLQKPVVELTDEMTKHVWASLGWGLVVLILVPIISLILTATIIGIPLALMLLGFWALLLYPAKILAAITLGKVLVGQKFMSPKYHNSLILATIVGIVLCWFVFSVPIAGWIIGFLAFLWGLGGIFRYAKSKS